MALSCESHFQRTFRRWTSAFSSITSNIPKALTCNRGQFLLLVERLSVPIFSHANRASLASGYYFTFLARINSTMRFLRRSKAKVISFHSPQGVGCERRSLDFQLALVS